MLITKTYAFCDCSGDFHPESDNMTSSSLHMEWIWTWPSTVNSEAWCATKYPETWSWLTLPSVFIYFLGVDLKDLYANDHNDSIFYGLILKTNEKGKLHQKGDRTHRLWHAVSSALCRVSKSNLGLSTSQHCSASLTDLPAVGLTSIS